MTNLTNDEMLDLGKTRSAREWDDVCDRIKAARGGHYPPDWWARIQQSGFMAQTERTWKPEVRS
jgi:hypothetical protein